MAFYLRDETLTDYTVDRDAIRQIAQAFAARQGNIPTRGQVEDGNPNSYLTFTIRFDNKGHKVFSLDDFLLYFDQAKYVERLIFTLESSQCLSTSRAAGAYMELKLAKDAPASYLVVTADDEPWVDASLCSIVETMDRFKNRNALARNAWTLLAIQFLGIFISFAISIWGAKLIAPSLSIDNAFLISFLLVLLVLSNLWALINQKLFGLINYAFPAMSFHRPKSDQTHWLVQTIVGGIVLAVALFFLNFVFRYLGQTLGAVLVTPT